MRLAAEAIQTKFYSEVLVVHQRDRHITSTSEGAVDYIYDSHLNGTDVGD